MRTARFALSLAVFALVFSSTHAAHGQGIVQSGGGFGAGGVVFSASGVQGANSEPYTAVRKTTHVQKLADGTTITHETTVKEAHDSSGRSYHESHGEVNSAGTNEQGQELAMYNVNDPVNRIIINWNSNSKEANVMHMPDTIQNRPVLPNPPPIHPTPPPQVSQRPVPPRPNIEKLGTQTINGIEAEGTRVTRIIPEGTEGNDRPMTVTSETWTSRELKMVVKSINDDPRTGTSTMEMTDFERGEPDPALFQVPADYTVREIFPNQPN